MEVAISYERGTPVITRCALGSLGARSSGEDIPRAALSYERGAPVCRTSADAARRVGTLRRKHSTYTGTSLITNRPPPHATVGICLGPYGGPRGGGGFLWARYPCMCLVCGRGKGVKHEWRSGAGDVPSGCGGFVQCELTRLSVPHAYRDSSLIRKYPPPLGPS